MKLASLSAPFIKRPVATTLLTIGIALAGMVSFSLLPVSPLPQVDFPAVNVSASLPGASPETMSTSVTTPLERQLGRIAGVTEMTSSSSLGNTRITLVFDLSRDIDGAARDVQAALNAALAQLPSVPTNPTYRKINPADAPIMIIAMTSKTLTPGQIYDAASNVVAQKISQVEGVGQASINGATAPAVRVDINPSALNKYGIALDTIRIALQNANANRPKGYVEEDDKHWQIYTNDQLGLDAAPYQNLIVTWKDGAPVRLSDVAKVSNGVQDIRNQGLYNGEPAVVIQVIKQPGANIIETIDRILREAAGFRMGPFELMDLTGVDVSHPVMESVYDQFYQEPRFRPSYLLRQRYVAGLLGRKVGRGFYSYRDGKAAPVPEPAGVALMAASLFCLALRSALTRPAASVARTNGRESAGRGESTPPR